MGQAKPVYWALWTAPRSMDGDQAETTSPRNEAGSTWRSTLVSLVARLGRCQKASANEKTAKPSAIEVSRVSRRTAASG